jgi:hypothetical protein
MILLVVAIPAFCQRASALEARQLAMAERKVAAYIASQLRTPREMEQTNLGVIERFPQWEGFPLTHWRYTTPDKKTAEVIMLNPSNEQLAKWVVNACFETKGGGLSGEDLFKFSKQLCDQIIGQTGGQFPVAGIVYENMGGGAFLVWGFRDGVTVGYSGIENEVPTQVTERQIKASLNRLTPLRYVGYQARLQSLTREEYIAAGGKENVSGRAFLDVNRKFYQEAWNHGRNQMLIYWAKVNLK